MRRHAALMATVLLLSGCSGFDRFLDDTVRLPGSDNPEAPKGDSENMMKARGQMVTSTPILPQSGNIWPSRPPALPTLSDVANDEQSFSLSDYSHAFGADEDVVKHEQGTNHTLPSDFPEDGDLTAGEKNQIKNGATINKSGGFGSSNGGILPDHIDDHAPKYIEKDTNNKPIIIPNGDGTSTVISSTGKVSVIKDSHKSEKSAKTQNTSSEPQRDDTPAQKNAN
ncbi:hypothetical protein [Commensalibacter papalotli (ex Servin-Garciduenas et al. 2014)]|uniref:Lipoprotein n=3 Tax=Commensalibacter TaxID=1079922 RepID=W7DX74_9PROT|nr:hypothetical protein [Commensalibacter papalotli (ex Servin-Garciduenas et al. 2014)]EUK18798.1 hypothetical protein COMX_03580 [Commensalibacter papalotli (ex Servin-Garciduenas et al. 2014)]CAI3924680.1 unnamed protein product [Commensalibacter papalotli (ex Botero et al. 2024)]CAI3927409.1 unnamed protein product [Commensalibacter papalotli (ex Botero et al. 2024)]